MEAEIEQELKDEDLFEDLEDDKKLVDTDADTAMSGFFLAAPAIIGSIDADDPRIADIAKYEKEFGVKLHKQLRSMEKTMKKYIQKNFGGSSKEEKIDPVELYREDGIPKEERDRRIKAGKEQLKKMMNNAMKEQGSQQLYRRRVQGRRPSAPEDTPGHGRGYDPARTGGGFRGYEGQSGGYPC